VTSILDYPYSTERRREGGCSGDARRGADYSRHGCAVLRNAPAAHEGRAPPCSGMRLQRTPLVPASCTRSALAMNNPGYDSCPASGSSPAAAFATRGPDASGFRSACPDVRRGEAASPERRTPPQRGSGDLCASGARGCGAIGYRASGSVGPDWSGLRLVLRSEDASARRSRTSSSAKAEASLLRRVASAARGASAAALTRPKSAPRSRADYP